MKPAFTLIELLVVVTLIVVLLAILTPAMDKAIYHAELTACGANLHGIATGAQTYAPSFGQRYPYRPQVMGGAAPHNIRNTDVNGLFESAGFADNRTMLRDYMALDLFNDPLNGRVDFDTQDPDSNIFGSCYLWSGAQYESGGVAQPGMLRLGDRWSWLDDRFGVLAGDHDVVNTADTNVHGSHPDADGMMNRQIFQDQDAAEVFGVGFAYKVVAARWHADHTHERGPIEMNFVFNDGAVARYDRVVVRPGGLPDERMALVPQKTNGDNPASLWSHVPPP